MSESGKRSGKGSGGTDQGPLHAGVGVVFAVVGVVFLVTSNTIALGLPFTALGIAFVAIGLAERAKQKRADGDGDPRP